MLQFAIFFRFVYHGVVRPRQIFFNLIGRYVVFWGLTEGARILGLFQYSILVFSLVARGPWASGCIAPQHCIIAQSCICRCRRLFHQSGALRRYLRHYLRHLILVVPQGY